MSEPFLAKEVDPPDNANHFVGSVSLQGDQQAIATARDMAMARVERRQEEAHQFLVEYGAAVVDGHEPQMVVRPGFPTPMSGDVWDPTAI